MAMEEIRISPGKLIRKIPVQCISFSSAHLHEKSFHDGFHLIGHVGRGIPLSKLGFSLHG